MTGILILQTSGSCFSEYICQLLETGNKFLVFAHHKSVLDDLGKLLEDKKTLLVFSEKLLFGNVEFSLFFIFKYKFQLHSD